MWRLALTARWNETKFSFSSSTLLKKWQSNLDLLIFYLHLLDLMGFLGHCSLIKVLAAAGADGGTRRGPGQRVLARNQERNHQAKENPAPAFELFSGRQCALLQIKTLLP